MAKPAAITQINFMRLALLTGASALLSFACITLFSTFYPAQRGNLHIEKALLGKNPDLKKLREQQEELLALSPADPFAWTRYSFLIQQTSGDRYKAFAALRMANRLSPNEPRQMLERAVMWSHFRDLFSTADRVEQGRLWQAAFTLRPNETVLYALKSDDFEEINNDMLVNYAVAPKWKQQLTKYSNNKK